ncbi:DNA-binding protein YbaB [Stackebrandtia albiflava]|uniref:DNA-binding protein YbaB n=1 Tax=Stackebrandtia albiflava TaxID=406432 RepID=A0A562UQG1_9ACTN|nr:YbaB/EbfC family nucleoid-associated protein [Stackebrandtia albiflava]TWJ07851.1 DNA-binding protein YbaB [Stackebrandtia albiflava]
MDSTPDDGARRDYREMAQRLRKAKVTATSPQGVVKVVYTGFGEVDEVTCRRGALRLGDDELGAHFTAAFRAADRAVDALHQHAYGGLRLGDDTVAGWRENPETAADTVARCFGEPVSSGGQRRSA